MKQTIRTTLYWSIFFMLQWAVQLNIGHAGTLTPQDSTTEVVEIRIDPVAAPGGVDAVLFDSIVYIPLETDRASEFSTITRLEVTDDYYIILDEVLNTLFFFNRDGSFSHKIDKNHENKAFENLRRFTVDRSGRTLLFEDIIYKDRKMPSVYNYVYELDGGLIEAIEIDIKNRVSFRDVVLFNGFKVGYLPQYADNRNDSAYFDGIVRYDAETDEILGSYLPVDTVRKNGNLLGVSKYLYVSNGEQLLFTQPYDYTIYAFDSLAVPHAQYQVVLPLANTLPTDFLTNPIYHGKWRDYTAANRSQIYSIRDVYVSGDWLTFYTTPPIQGSAFLYNLVTYELFNLKETRDSSLGLPVTRFLQPVLGVHDGALISELPFADLKKLYEELPGAERKHVFPPQLLELMNKESHNAILRLSYLKQDY